MNRKTFVISMTFLLVIASLAYGQALRPSAAVVSGSSFQANIDTEAEYSNGSLGSPHEGLALWYDWISTNETQIIFLAYYSQLLNPPIITFIGQHYYTENGTEVFVGNTLTVMEVYNDTNGNGLPDADYVSGTREILYSFVVNSSVSFDITPIEKTIVDGLPHYKWGIKYQTIDGFLLTENYSSDLMVTVDYMDFAYDFYIENNVSYLKTNFSIGKILNATSSYSSMREPVSLDGLSLALLYGTTIVTSKPYITLVNGNQYNSTTAPASVQPANLGEIKIDAVTTYKFVFGQNYTLYRDTQQETHTSKSTAVSNQSVSSGLEHLNWIISDLETVLSSLFPKISNLQVAINLEYNVSSFLYRVCYPVWDGCKLQHDPTYIAYLNAGNVPELSLPLTFIIVAAIVSTLALAAALIDLSKTRRTLKASLQVPMAPFQ
jgi:hypothetical protein